MAEARVHIFLVKRWLLLLAIALLSVAWQEPTTGALPDTLRKYRAADQLTEWIYTQLQWPAATPLEKAAILKQATTHIWRLPKTAEEVQAWQDLLINQGYTLLLSGDIVSSTDAYQQAFEWARQHLSTTDESLVLEYILKPLGNNYTRLGDYEQALFIHQKALALANSLQDQSALAGTYSNLTNTAGNMGQLEQARLYCQEGLKVADKKSALYGLLLSEQADVCEKLSQHDIAKSSIRESIRILRQQPAGDQEAAHWLFMAYQQAGDIYLSTPITAKQYYQEALHYMRRKQVVRKREQAKLYQRLGQLYVALEEPQHALSWLDSCARILLPGKDFRQLKEEDMYGEYTLLDMLFARAAAYNQLQQPDAALQAYRLCFATEHKLRSQFISASAKEMAVSDSRSRYEMAIETAYNCWLKTRQTSYQQVILQFMENSKSQLLWEEMLQQAQYHTGDSTLKRIRLLEQAQIYYRKEALQNGGGDSLLKVRQQRVAWDLATLRKKMPVMANDTLSVGHLTKLLPDKHVIRSYFAGTTGLYSIELDKQGIRFTNRLAITTQWHDSLLYFRQHYFENGAQAMINTPKAYYDAAYRIYAQLFRQQPLQTGNTYMLMPDGVLSTIPLEALVTDSVYPAAIGKWPFLVKQATIAYAYSLRTWQAQLSGDTNKKGFSGFFIARQQHGLAALQGVEAEKELMAPVISNGRWFPDAQATVASFRQALTESAIVHISTHAFLKQDSMQAPHIAFYDAPFYLFELNALPRHPAMVVLSACGTADGRLVTGEGVQSLAHAFMAIGTPAVVAALWNVNDATTPQLMQTFYKTLSTTANAAAALQQAKLSWLKDPAVTDMHKLPYYWAALGYQGNTQALQAGVLPARGNYWYWLLLLLGIPVFILLKKISNNRHI
ncbi:CHAT domain-containing protein [Chitinophaga sp. MM2321]|uniref:CHAT domain-containing protein n=1 Tax=Chitinophaga sp. MM2321 TaxID=3137178 RepID=UPI0032D57302